jgi:hypothetical protein
VAIHDQTSWRLVLKAVLVAFVLSLLQPHVVAQQQDFSRFENDIRPVLQNQCVKCHGERRAKGKLRLHTPAAIMKGGQSGPVIVKGKPSESLLIHAIGYADPDLQMPPKKKIDGKTIAAFVTWVKEGAAMPADTSVGNTSERPQAFNLAERKKHWAWQPVTNPTPPIGNSWSSHPVDGFIWESLAASKLAPAAKAKKRVLVRRIFFDLIGLPPTPEQVDHFLNDTNPGAWKRLVDELLASPHFGEKWGRHWLDLMGYTETQGFEYDFHLPNAWQYRDYVIRALNADVPYDQFVTEHIAGDLLKKPRRNPSKGFDEAPLGTAFWLFGQEPHSPVSTRVDQLDRAARKIDVMSKAFLGVTVACARCHDHKFDAISTEDYYALNGFIQSSSYRQMRFETEETNLKIAKGLAELRLSQGPKLLSAIGKDLLFQLRDLEGIIGQAISKPTPKTSPQVSAWRDHLVKAEKDATDPFFGLTSFSETLANKAPPSFEFRQPVLDDKTRLIEDYTTAGRQPHWYANGPGFGLGPVKLGDVRISDDASRPVRSLVTRSAASWDRQWQILKPAARTQKSPTALNWPQAGRTLKTRSLKLTSGQLHYLVRGEGVAFAEINSHRVIHGPLHGKSIRRFAAADGGLQWVTHDLTGYVGRRIHLEFSSVGEQALDVLMIVESEKAPSIEHLPLPMLTSLRNSTQKPAPKPSLYVKALKKAARQAARGKLSNDAAGHEAAWLVNWMLANPSLMGPPSQSAIAANRTRFQTIIDEKQKLTRAIRPVSQQASVLMDGSGVNERVLLRGSHLTPSKPAPRRFLSAIDGRAPLLISAGSGRLELAERLTDSENPLFLRVIVNRLWHHIFGKGLVKTTDDFGVKGLRPSHPELLDWLARDFVKNKWSVKTMLKQLVMSESYQMASRHLDPRAIKADPENKLLHRMPRRRLTAEAVRDAIITTSGSLDRKMYGQPIPMHLTPFMQGRGRPKPGPLDGLGRRSVYLAVRLNFLSPFFLAFDFPRPTGCIGRRTNSNVPAQSLALMNDPFVMGQATFWAKRILAIESQGDIARVKQLYLEAYARPPRSSELKKAIDFLGQATKHHGGKIEPAWADLCHVLFNTKEFWHLL